MGYNVGLPILKRLNQFTKENPFIMGVGFFGITVGSVVGFKVMLSGAVDTCFYNITRSQILLMGLESRMGLAYTE